MEDELATALGALSPHQLDTVHRQVVTLGATSKREGDRASGSFWAAVMRAVQREELHRMRAAASETTERFGTGEPGAN